MRQVESVLPDERVTRVRVLALFAAGVLWAGSVTLLKVAAALPLPAADPSIERRLKRFVTNPRVRVAARWEPLLPVVLRALGQREVVLVSCWSSIPRPTATAPRSWWWGSWCATACCRWSGGWCRTRRRGRSRWPRF
jgi:hypothetical protein